MPPAADIRDLKPLASPAAAELWGPLAAVALALVLAAVLVAWLRSRRSRRTASRQPADERALALLAALGSEPPSGPETLRRRCFELSALVRSYLEERFGVPVTDRTSEEILADAAALALLPNEARELLGGFLAATDVVKYARREPPRFELPAAVACARRIVELTRPPTEPPSAARRGRGGALAPG